MNKKQGITVKQIDDLKLLAIQMLEELFEFKSENAKYYKKMLEKVIK